MVSLWFHTVRLSLSLFTSLHPSALSPLFNCSLSLPPTFEHTHRLLSFPPPAFLFDEGLLDITVHPRRSLSSLFVSSSSSPCPTFSVLSTEQKTKKSNHRHCWLFPFYIVLSWSWAEYRCKVERERRGEMLEEQVCLLFSVSVWIFKFFLVWRRNWYTLCSNVSVGLLIPCGTDWGCTLVLKGTSYDRCWGEESSFFFFFFSEKQTSHTLMDVKLPVASAPRHNEVFEPIKVKEFS